MQNTIKHNTGGSVFMNRNIIWCLFAAIMFSLPCCKDNSGNKEKENPTKVKLKPLPEELTPDPIMIPPDSVWKKDPGKKGG